MGMVARCPMKPVILTPALLVLMLSVQPVVAEQEESMSYAERVVVAGQLQTLIQLLSEQEPPAQCACAQIIESLICAVESTLAGHVDLESCTNQLDGVLSVGFTTDDNAIFQGTSWRLSIDASGIPFQVDLPGGISELEYPANITPISGEYFVQLFP